MLEQYLPPVQFCLPLPFLPNAEESLSHPLQLTLENQFNSSHFSKLVTLNPVAGALSALRSLEGCHAMLAVQT